MKKVLKILMYLVLVYVVAVVTYGIVLKVKESINEKEKIKKQSPFTDRISFKYPESNISSVEILEKIQKKVKREEKIDLKDGKYRINLYDDKNRLVYTILEENRVEKSVSSGVKSGKRVEYKAQFPKEEGILYNEKGDIEAKLLINQKYLSFYPLDKSKNQQNRASFYYKRMLGEERIINYEYSSSNEYKTVEYEIEHQFNRDYKKIEKEYKSNKLTKEYILIDREGGMDDASSKILVEITKEYDENEKLIKKFVLRKNKFNSVRSETNFDLIKGEIITKYYEGDKVFATVIETLIGKDRAIVKRERVGDEFVIWDFQIKGLNKINSEIYITRKNNVLYKTNKFISESGGEYQKNIYGVNEYEYLWETYDNLNFKTDYGNDFSIVVWNFNSVLGIENNKINKYELNEQGIYFFKELKNKREKEWLKNNSKWKEIEENLKELKNIDKIKEEFRSGY